MKLPLNNKQMLMIGGIVLGIALVLFLSMSVVPNILVTLTKAAASEKVVTANSYMIGQKILAKADGEDKCIVNVFLLDKNGRGVAGKAVELSGMENIVGLSPRTDNMGKITFEMTSKTAGQYKISASTAGGQLMQTVTVTFR